MRNRSTPPRRTRGLCTHVDDFAITLAVLDDAAVQTANDVGMPEAFVGCGKVVSTGFDLHAVDKRLVATLPRLSSIASTRRTILRPARATPARTLDLLQRRLDRIAPERTPDLLQRKQATRGIVLGEVDLSHGGREREYGSESDEDWGEGRT